MSVTEEIVRKLLRNSVVEADPHSAIDCLSPVKTAKSGVHYFDGLVTDGSQKLQIVELKVSNLTLQKYSKSNLTIKVEECQLKRVRSDGMEIFLSKRSKILPSTKKL